MVPSTVISPTTSSASVIRPLRLAAAGHRKQTHGQSPAGTDHGDPGPHTGEERQRGVPHEAAGSLASGQLTLDRGSAERPAVPHHSGAKARKQERATYRHHRHGDDSRAPHSVDVGSLAPATSRVCDELLVAGGQVVEGPFVVALERRAVHDR